MYVGICMDTPSCISNDGKSGRNKNVIARKKLDLLVVSLCLLIYRIHSEARNVICRARKNVWNVTLGFYKVTFHCRRKWLDVESKPQKFKCDAFNVCRGIWGRGAFAAARTPQKQVRSTEVALCQTLCTSSTGGGGGICVYVPMPITEQALPWTLCICANMETRPGPLCPYGPGGSRFWALGATNRSLFQKSVFSHAHDSFMKTSARDQWTPHMPGCRKHPDISNFSGKDVNWPPTVGFLCEKKLGKIQLCTTSKSREKSGNFGWCESWQSVEQGCRGEKGKAHSWKNNRSSWSVVLAESHQSDSSRSCTELWRSWCKRFYLCCPLIIVADRVTLYFAGAWKSCADCPNRGCSGARLWIDSSRATGCLVPMLRWVCSSQNNTTFLIVGYSGDRTTHKMVSCALFLFVVVHFCCPLLKQRQGSESLFFHWQLRKSSLDTVDTRSYPSRMQLRGSTFKTENDKLFRKENFTHFSWQLHMYKVSSSKNPFCIEAGWGS